MLPRATHSRHSRSTMCAAHPHWRDRREPEGRVMGESISARGPFVSRWSRRSLLQTAAVGGAASAAVLAACGGKAPKAAGTTQSAAQGAGALKRGGTLTTFGTNPPPDGMETQGVRGNAAPTQPYFVLIHNGLM